MRTVGLILFLLVCLRAHSQQLVRGVIKGPTGYLPLVSVIVSRDSLFKAADETDSLGNFEISGLPPGYYKLHTSLTGYEAQEIFFTVDSLTPVTDLPEIVLARLYTLDEVVVESRRDLLDHKMDRLVIHLSDLTSAGNNALEILQKSPGVVVNRQTNSISMNGKSGVRIMINEKIVQVPADMAVQFLEGINGSNLESIELISAPPAAYDANGGGGIIRIVTTGQTELGSSAIIGITLGAHWAETFGTNLRLNHRSNKAAYSFDYTVSRNHNLHHVDIRRHSKLNELYEYVEDHSRRENRTTQQNLNLGSRWNISTRTSLDLSLSGYHRDWKLKAVAQNRTMSGSDAASVTMMNVSESNVWQGANASIGLEHRLASQRTFQLGVDYLLYHNDNPSDYRIITTDQSDISLAKKTPIQFVVLTANYKSKPGAFNWDTGIKAVASTLNNDVTVRRNQSGDWITDPLLTSFSTVREKVYAGYVSGQWIPNKLWKLNGGVRYEYTEMIIDGNPATNRLTRKYGYLFPSLSLSRKMVDREFYINYSRRITRPTYNDIAPYVFFWGPNSFSAGNTSLLPAVSDAVSTGYHDGPFSLSMQATVTIAEVVMMQPEIDVGLQSLVLRSQNLRDLRTISLNMSYTKHITSWWSLTSNLTAQHQQLRTREPQPGISRHRYGINAVVTNSIDLPLDLSMEIYGVYQSCSLSGISDFLPYGSLNAGIQKKFKNAALKLAMDDVLYTNQWWIKTSTPDNDLNMFFKYDWHNQFIRLTYTWNLGNQKFESLKLNSQTEEQRKRVGN